MKKKQLPEISLNDINRFIFNSEYFFRTSDFFISTDYNQSKAKGVLFKIGIPYRFKDVRIVQVLKGSMVVSVNLIKYTIPENDIILLPPDSIVQMTGVSPDLNFRLVTASVDFMKTSDERAFFESYISNTHHFKLFVQKKELKAIDDFFALIWSVSQIQPFRHNTVQSLLGGFLHQLEYIRNNHQKVTNNPLSRQEDIFNRFIALVNKHSKAERSINFYATQMHLSPRHLNTVIRKVSGRTIKEWIEESVIIEAKVMLKHSNMLIYQIADELNFPNPSFFCKFFKRISGMSPLEYQKE